jgi:hypothetical protein
MRPLLAFVHIEKAAGTTLIYLLRRHYLLRYADVRPLHAESEGVFRAADLRTYVRLNPFLLGIGGHSIRPFSDLDAVRDIRYITILRDPVKRYLSQYRYWRTALKSDWTFERFLEHEPSHDFQTRKLAGSPDVGEAIRQLTSKPFLVGIAEEFDAFLVELKHWLNDQSFDIRYTRRNVTDEGKVESPDALQQFEARIRSNNARDIELYHYVVDTLLPRQRAAYAGDLAAAVTRFKEANDGGSGTDLRLLLDATMRKLYLEPVTGLVRRVRGMPYKGSY